MKTLLFAIKFFIHFNYTMLQNSIERYKQIREIIKNHELKKYVKNYNVYYRTKTLDGSAMVDLRGKNFYYNIWNPNLRPKETINHEIFHCAYAAMIKRHCINGKLPSNIVDILNKILTTIKSYMNPWSILSLTNKIGYIEAQEELIVHHMAINYPFKKETLEFELFEIWKEEPIWERNDYNLAA